MIGKILCISVVAILLCCLAGCQTVRGVGGDIQWTADKCEEIIGGP